MTPKHDNTVPVSDIFHNFRVDLSDAANQNEAVQNLGYILSCCQTNEDLGKYGEHLCQGIAGVPHHVKVRCISGVSRMEELGAVE